MERNDVVKKAIIKHLKRNLKTRYGMFSNRQGELRMWFEQHLDDIIPMAFGPKDSDGRAVVAKVFCEGRGVAEVAQSIGKSPRTVYNYIDAFFDTLVDNLPDDVFNTLSRKAAGLQMWRHKACQKPGCGGDMYYDDVGGAQHPGSEWVCILCGCRVAHETRVTTPR